MSSSKFLTLDVNDDQYAVTNHNRYVKISIRQPYRIKCNKNSTDKNTNLHQRYKYNHRQPLQIQMTTMYSTTFKLMSITQKTKNSVKGSKLRIFDTTLTHCNRG